MLNSLLLNLLRILPKNHLSFVLGKLVHLPLGSRLSRFLLERFVKHYCIDIEEVDGDLEDFCCVGDFFTRDLKPEARPIEEGIVSPVDGEVIEYGTIDNDLLLQAKGKTYTVLDLLQAPELAEQFLNGFFITLYLAPRDYHHIHSPVSGAITSSYHIEGTLWPVNHNSAQKIDGLFTINERVVTVINEGSVNVAVVKVGATNVGSISVIYDDFVTNSCPKFFKKDTEVHVRHYDSPKTVMKGDRLGTFHLGSTVVVLFPPKFFDPGPKCNRGAIKMGVSLTD